MITKFSHLAIFDPSKEISLENDASEHGKGSVLLQEGRPIALKTMLQSMEKEASSFKKVSP